MFVVYLSCFACCCRYSLLCVQDFQLRLHVLYVCGVMQSSQNCSKMSFSFQLVCVEFGAFFGKSFYYCCVFIRKFGLDFDLIVLEYFEFKFFSRYCYEEFF
jgi:hypothetical protein